MHPRIYAYLLRLRLDPGVADELTQDVMTTLWQKAELFDRTKSSVGTWLFRIARNRRIDLLRRDREDTVPDARRTIRPIRRRRPTTRST